MKQIILTQGMVAIVDDCDYDLASKKWCFNHYPVRYEGPRRGRKRVLMHRVIAERFLGPIPAGLVVDHINHNKVDNRRENLRYVTRSINGLNRTTGYARKANGRYYVQVRGVAHSFKTELQALAFRRILVRTSK